MIKCLQIQNIKTYICIRLEIISATKKNGRVTQNKMKIEIQSGILGYEKEVSELNYIIHLAKSHSNLKDFKADVSQTEFFTLDYGFGSNHCWVKQYAQDADLKYSLGDENILAIFQ